jgi:phospholipid/cholesterol/gamma-HCH transport system substrate-binding protein
VRARGRVSPFGAGLLALVVIVAAAWFAYTKRNPFSDPYRVEAIFQTANELKQRSPVRIAGVDVGKVVGVEPLDDGSGLARVSMEITDAGRPIKRDAEMRIRNRIFLEGNYFVDVEPGTPSSPELRDGGTIPPSQTASPVQFGQVLNALQADTRSELQTFFKEYSRALEGQGAKGFNNAIKYWERAYSTNAVVARATLGTEDGDLGRVLRGQGRVFGALSEDEEALKDFVSALNDTMRAFASQEDNLRAAIPALRDVLLRGRPALQSLNRALPSIRAFARDALPGARSSAPTLDAQLPFVKELRRLVQRAELGGLAPELRQTVPTLAKLNQSQARSLAQTRALAACQNRVLLPFSKTPIPDPDFPANTGQPFYKQSQRAFVGLSGESRMQDANSPFFRVQAGGGPTTLVTTGEAGERYFAQPLFPIDAVRPAPPAERPVFRPGVPCETQEPPDLNAPSGAAEQPTQPKPVLNAANRARMARARRELGRVGDHLAREAKGLPSVDPLAFNDKGERIQRRELGLKRR